MDWVDWIGPSWWSLEVRDKHDIAGKRDNDNGGAMYGYWSLSADAPAGSRCRFIWLAIVRLSAFWRERLRVRSRSVFAG